jgi:hypothetical protein
MLSTLHTPTFIQDKHPVVRDGFLSKAFPGKLWQLVWKPTRHPDTYLL